MHGLLNYLPTGYTFNTFKYHVTFLNNINNSFPTIMGGDSTMYADCGRINLNDLCGFLTDVGKHRKGL